MQLITQKLGSKQQYMFIVQFNDCIVQASLNEPIFKVICEPEAMIRRHLVRGYSEKIFYAESSGNAEKIMQLEFHKSKPNEITKKEIFQLAGSWIVAFELDGENIQNDIDNDEVVAESLYIMDDQQKIYLVKNEDGVRFNVKKVIDFAPHEKIREVNALRDNDWSHVHITERTLSFGDSTYNLNSKLEIPITVPKLFFGETKRQGAVVEEEGQDDDDDGNESMQTDSEEEEESLWNIQSVQSMSMTANIIA